VSAAQDGLAYHPGAMRSTTWLSILVAGTLLSACGGASGASPASSSSPTTAPPSAAASAAASPSAKPAASGGVVSAKPAAGAVASGAPFKVGLLEALTGPIAEIGKDDSAGFALYLESVNNTVAGRQITLDVADTLGQPDTALAKAKQLVENDKVDVLMGLTVSASCYAVAQYVKQAGVPFIASNNCAAQNMMVDPKFKSPYLIRITQNSSLMADVPAAWAADQGFKKADIVGVNQGGTLENTDAFASTFIKHDGSIVQELHPSNGTQDYGPIVAQLDRSADVLMTFLPGTDGIRFFQQYADYAGGQKGPQIIDGYGGNTSGQALAELQAKVAGVVGEDVYSLAIDSPENQALKKAWSAKYPKQALSDDGAKGYTAAEVLAAAVKKVNGDLSDKQKFLQALYDTNVQTPRGPIKLDQDHDVISNAYVWQIDKGADGYAQKLLKTYDSLARNWDRTPQELEKFPYGKLKDKWVGMTKAQLQALSQ